MGIALYELRDYRAAIPCLQKALLQNSEDPVANGYLYYAFLESGRNEDAAMLAFTYRKSPDVIPGSAGGRLRYV
jgi:tetratricopeptide (TPR) repeat protein